MLRMLRMKPLVGACSVLIAGVVCAIAAVADPPVPLPGGTKSLLKCTGETESSQSTAVDCEDDPTLCGEPEDGVCIGDRIVWRGESVNQQECVDGSAVSNWTVYHYWCAQTTECVLVQDEENNSTCSAEGDVSIAYVQGCKRLPENCKL